MTCHNGEVFEKLVEYPKGDPDNAVTWDESVDKFMSLATDVYTEEQSKKLVALIENLEQVENFRESVRKILVV